MNKLDKKAKKYNKESDLMINSKSDLPVKMCLWCEEKPITPSIRIARKVCKECKHSEIVLDKFEYANDPNACDDCLENWPPK